jgi:hypothetical protein
MMKGTGCEVRAARTFTMDSMARGAVGTEGLASSRNICRRCSRIPRDLILCDERRGA